MENGRPSRWSDIIDVVAVAGNQGIIFSTAFLRGWEQRLCHIGLIFLAYHYRGPPIHQPDDDMFIMKGKEYRRS